MLDELARFLDEEECEMVYETVFSLIKTVYEKGYRDGAERKPPFDESGED